MKDGFSLPEIEQAAVSAILQWPKCRNEADINLKPDYFSAGANRTLFELALEKYRAGEEIELIGFTQELRDKGLLEAVGGTYYVTQTWYDCCHSQTIISYYVERILEEAERKRLAEVCTDSAQQALAGAATIVSDTITAVSEIPLRRSRHRSISDAVEDKMERLQTGTADSDIIKTGIVELDIKSPLRKGDMPLITGERKSGKSILALSIAENVAQSGIPVVYFSLEDREPKVFDRIFSGLSRIPTSVSHVNKMSKEETARALAALEKARAMPLDIVDDLYDLHAIIARAKTFCARGDALVIIDYAQLIRVSGCESRRQEIEKVSRDLRLLAMETDCPVILICQLNKEGETRESKTLEMDCTAAWKMDLPEEEANHSERFIRVPFQRNGDSGISVRVTFLGSIARVENYSA